MVADDDEFLSDNTRSECKMLVANGLVQCGVLIIRKLRPIRERPRWRVDIILNMHNAHGVTMSPWYHGVVYFASRVLSPSVCRFCCAFAHYSRARPK